MSRPDGLPPECEYPVLGVAELADRLGTRRQYISRMVRSGVLPAPDHQLAMGPVWLLSPDMEAVIATIREETSP